MSNTIAIRLPTELFRRVRKSARVEGKSRSEVVRKALEDYFERTGPSAKRDPYEVLVSLMPLEGGGAVDLGARSEEYLRKKIHARSRSH